MASFVAIAFIGCESPKAAELPCHEEDVLFINGKIITLNPEQEVVDAMRIRDNKIVSVGQSALDDKTCVNIVDLNGKTVIPGLMDSHIHFVRQGNMPGTPVFEAENTRSIQELLNLLWEKAAITPENEILTILGGVSEKQFAERRLPTKKELDEALPNHAIYIQKGFSGPAIANQKALDFFESQGVHVNADGGFAMGDETNNAFSALKTQQSSIDREKTLTRLMNYANSLGLTAVQDQGGVSFLGAARFNPISDYDALTSLWREKQLNLRFRIQHVVYDKTAEDGDLEDKIDHTWQGFGDEMLKYTTVGEHIVSFPMDGHVNEAYEAKATKAAIDGWPHEQHSVSYDENIQHMKAIKSIHEKYPIGDLRWSLAHVFEMGIDTTKEMIADLKAMNMGLKLQNHAYVIPTDRFPLGKTFESENAGPLYRTLLETGIPLGAGTDGCLVVPINPWYSIYYMVTGKDASGELVNPNQTISRLDALRMYTLGSAWFSFDDHQLGSLEVGKLADFVVLNKDFETIPEEELKSVRAEMTFINGKQVY